MSTKKLSLSEQIEMLKAQLRWLASHEESCPSDKEAENCRQRLNKGVASDCTECWLDAAKKAVSEKP